MRTINPQTSSLLVVDFQTRLMPAIDAAEAAVANAGRLIQAANLLAVPVLATEQNPKGLGGTVPALALPPHLVLDKMTFDASRAEGFFERLGPRPDVVVTGCEAHVCVLQTVLGLIEAGRRVHVVADAVGSRRPDNKAAALRRMERHGAEIVTTEMVVFEWLGSAEHERFRDVVKLIK
jgi:nicotinamidase-related amidase